MHNIGGIKIGHNESSAIGSPAKFTLCVAEWEQRCEGWDPYHVTRGMI
jgi:hypothetical protein